MAQVLHNTLSVTRSEQCWWLTKNSIGHFLFVPIYSRSLNGSTSINSLPHFQILTHSDKTMPLTRQAQRLKENLCYNDISPPVVNTSTRKSVCKGGEEREVLGKLVTTPVENNNLHVWDSRSVTAGEERKKVRGVFLYRNLTPKKEIKNRRKCPKEF